MAAVPHVILAAFEQHERIDRRLDLPTRSYHRLGSPLPVNAVCGCEFKDVLVNIAPFVFGIRVRAHPHPILARPLFDDRRRTCRDEDRFRMDLPADSIGTGRVSQPLVEFDDFAVLVPKHTASGNEPHLVDLLIVVEQNERCLQRGSPRDVLSGEDRIARVLFPRDSVFRFRIAEGDVVDARGCRGSEVPHPEFAVVVDHVGRIQHYFAPRLFGRVGREDRFVAS